MVMPENETYAKNVQDSFLQLLSYLPKDLLEKAKSNQVVRVLSVGCGRFREAKSVFDYFKEYENKLNLFGIEADKELLDLAKEEEIIKSKKSQVFLKNADASNFENYSDWINNVRFDLIIVRHPEITFNTDVFIKIFSSCVNLLEKKGYLLITTHYQNEKEAIKLLLKLYKFNLLIEAENQNSLSFQKNGEILFADKYLLVLSL